MPNLNAPYGLRPSRKLGGGAVANAAYSIADGYPSAIYTGDVVEMSGEGRNVELAAAGATNPVGVFAGCNFIDAEGRVTFKPYWPAGQALEANTTVEALVYDDPSIVFRAQADTLASADIGALADWVGEGTGNVKTGRSAAQVQASVTATTGKTLRLYGLLREVGNEYGQYAEVEVMFAEHALKGVVSGVGGD
jgi:hypothetical protein